MGVTKERIRQIQLRAMGKLREAAEEAQVKPAIANVGMRTSKRCIPSW